MVVNLKYLRAPTHGIGCKWFQASEAGNNMCCPKAPKHYSFCGGGFHHGMKGEREEGQKV